MRRDRIGTSFSVSTQMRAATSAASRHAGNVVVLREGCKLFVELVEAVPVALHSSGLGLPLFNGLLLFVPLLLVRCPRVERSAVLRGPDMRQQA
jgi:hypothetical protein